MTQMFCFEHPLYHLRFGRGTEIEAFEYLTHLNNDFRTEPNERLWSVRPTTKEEYAAYELRAKDLGEELLNLLV